jgi:DNA-binding CsgD family transcriptional regulator
MTQAGRRVWRTLTKRERQVVLRLCTDAGTATDLATQMGIKPLTLACHLTKLYNKTGVDNRVGLTIFAFNNGWIIPAWVRVTVTRHVDLVSEHIA